ncbi:MAG: hypothetical protein K2O28_05490 [Clostridia bacterium]|nr:hypothetical protein [Clostridia bacterium]
MENEFTIKNKPITFKLAITFTVTSVALALTMVLLIIACRIYEKNEFIWFIEIIPAAALVGSILGLYTFYKEEFSLKDGQFRYVKVFKKDIVIKVKTLYCVYLSPLGYKTKIEFMNYKCEIFETIYDDGTIMQDGIFLDALRNLRIDVKRNGYGDE